MKPLCPSVRNLIITAKLDVRRDETILGYHLEAVHPASNPYNRVAYGRAGSI